jgi:hypothetical protein
MRGLVFTVRWSAFFGAQSAAGVGLGSAPALEAVSGRRARRFFCLRFFIWRECVSQACRCYPSMPGPNLGASQIGLVLVDVPFVSLARKIKKIK